ncbi:unnamed protein product, partial [Ectocarpus sp. 13 AM-2016]
VSRDHVESAKNAMATSTSINRGDESTENTPLGILALLKFATLLSVTACFLLTVAKKAADSAVMLITRPPDVVPRPAPSPDSAPPQPGRWRGEPVVQRQKTEEVQRIKAAAEERVLKIQNGGGYHL